jgi:hypothetical protein
LYLFSNSNYPSPEKALEQRRVENGASLGSILDSLTTRCSPRQVSSAETSRLATKLSLLKTKLSASELDAFKCELISSVNVAIQDTFRKYFGPSAGDQVSAKSCAVVAPGSVNVEGDVQAPKPKPLQQQSQKQELAPPVPSHNFNMARLLEVKKASGVRVGDTNKRKLSQSHNPQHPEKHAKLSASGNLMLNTQHSRQQSSTPSLSSSSSTSSSSAKQQQQKHQSVVNQFYSAALSHLQHTNPASKAPANPFALASGPNPFSPNVAGNSAAVAPFANSPGNSNNQRYVITTNNY